MKHEVNAMGKQCPIPVVKATRALRAHEALVARKAQNADVLRAHIDGEHARRLRRIDDKQQSVRRAERANARQIKQVPRQI